MDIKAKDISSLKEITGAGLMDCKNALISAEGNVDKAIEILREKGIAKAAKKESRIAGEGFISVYDHANGKFVSLVEINIETDFAAKNAELREFGHNLAMQVVAMRPQYVSVEDIPASVVESEKNIYRTQLLNEGKPEAVVEKIVAGKLNKFYEEVCLMEQIYLKDPDGKKKVKDVLTEFVSKIGEKIKIRRIYLMVMGEGIEKRKDDFAAEVAAQTQTNK